MEDVEKPKQETVQQTLNEMDLATSNGKPKVLFLYLYYLYIPVSCVYA